jgi:hypothetical protein
MKKHFAIALAVFMTVQLFCASYCLSQNTNDFLFVGKYGKQPKLAFDSKDRAALVYGNGEAIFSAITTDSGKSFSKPAQVGLLSGMMLGKRRGPQVAWVKDGIVVSAIGAAGDIISWNSKNDGKSWIGPVTITDKRGAAKEGLHAICGGDANAVFAVWIDLRDSKSKLYGSRSLDAGKTWSENLLIYESPSGTICECCAPSAVFGPSNTLNVMWRNSVEGARDLYLIKSNDGGVSFGLAEKLGKGTWPLQACPMDGGSLAVNSKGEVFTVWRREDKIYLSQGKDEKLLGTGTQPVIAISDTDAIYIAWHEKGSIQLLYPGETTPREISKGYFPSLSISKAEKSAPFLIWEMNEGRQSGIWTSVIP